MPPVRTGRLFVTALVVAVAACTTSPGESLPTDQPVRSGAVVGTIRDEPQTFNRLVARDNVSALMTELTQAGLVRINRTQDVVEPWLAQSWRSDDDGRTHTLTLREGVTFSDGEPFSSADVLFSFEAVYDERLGSTLADSLRVDGRPIVVDAPDATTVVVRFPVPYSPGLRLLAGLPILPRHLLEQALREGTLHEAWGLSTPPAEMVGMGPFVLESYQPGQRLVFGRNSRYWRTDEAGVQLPYLDRITLEIVADQNAEMLRLETGQVDFISSGIRAEDFASLSRAAEAGQVQLFHLGVGLDADFLAFNLQPAAMAADPRRSWRRASTGGSRCRTPSTALGSRRPSTWGWPSRSSGRSHPATEPGSCRTYPSTTTICDARRSCWKASGLSTGMATACARTAAAGRCGSPS